MGVEEVLYNSTGFITSVITEQSAAPMSREENVARALNVFEGLKGRQNKAYTFCLTEGMIKVAEGRGRPRLNAASFGRKELGEKRFAVFCTRADGSADEVVFSLTVRIGETRALGTYNRVGFSRTAQGEFETEVHQISLREQRIGRFCPHCSEGFNHSFARCDVTQYTDKDSADRSEFVSAGNGEEARFESCARILFDAEKRVGNVSADG